jgi:hypothetical protein
MEKLPDSKHHGNRDLRIFRFCHTICQSPVTEKEAYELSNSAEYDKNARLLQNGADLRFCQNRHAACYSPLRAADREHLPPDRLSISLLLVCRQAYIAANPILWSTNTWGFHDIEPWRQWRQAIFLAMNYIQQQLIQKVYLGANVVTECVDNYDISQFKIWDELYIDITVNSKDHTSSKLKNFWLCLP